MDRVEEWVIEDESERGRERGMEEEMGKEREEDRWRLEDRERRENSTYYMEGLRQEGEKRKREGKGGREGGREGRRVTSFSHLGISLD